MMKSRQCDKIDCAEGELVVQMVSLDGDEKDGD